MGDRKHDIFLVGRVLSFLRASANCIFIVHAVHTAHDYFIIMTHTLRLSEKKSILSRALVIRSLFLPPLSQLPFLFTNELSTSGIVLCSDQKFMLNARVINFRIIIIIIISHENIHVKMEIAIFFKN